MRWQGASTGGIDHDSSCVSFRQSTVQILVSSGKFVTHDARLASDEDVAFAQSIAIEQRGVCGALREAPYGDKLGMCSSIPPGIDPAM